MDDNTTTIAGSIGEVTALEVADHLARQHNRTVQPGADAADLLKVHQLEHDGAISAAGHQHAG